MKIGIVYKFDSVEIAREVAEFLEKYGYQAELHHIPSCALEDCGMIVTVGGDGTILRTLQELKNPPPIFGINTGRMGILTHASPENYGAELLRAAEGKLRIEEFMRIEASHKDVRVTALNEVAVVSSVQARLIEFEVYADGELIESMRADGAIFSTPTGSTAYSLSAGGPIIDPYSEAICFTPISPFRIGWRPWVLSPERLVKIRISELRDALAIADGNKSMEVGAGEEVIIKKSENPARFFEKSSRITDMVAKMRSMK
ncbi:NAD(+)/NADH kinase [Geoglobus acetivorans]|uniref:NAD kinase n=1 Tax=Geoglobus acetivorans TaxID=565033 RepID=A0ABZ3H5U4_GEOAI|nr:NAD(+)/NADH kinase [Geoglobus acetivorans]